MVDVWEDNELLSKKFISISKAEAFFTIAAIVSLYAGEKLAGYIFLTIMLLLALMPLWKRRQYEKRKRRETETTNQ